MTQYKKEKQNRPPLVIHCSKGSPLSPEALDWFRFHFPQSSTFDGYFQICYRGRTGFRTLWTGVQDNIEEFLSKMKIFSKSDYYISANCTTTVKRQKIALFAMQNIVIDIDCHQDHLHPEERNQFLEDFMFRFQEFDNFIPTPHSIVWTGRGLQLWWAIAPTHAKLLPFYDNVKQYFLHVIRSILDEYKLENLTLDQGASLNPVGVFRLPCTNNPTARQRVRLERTSVQKPYLLEDLEKIMHANKEELHFAPSQKFNSKKSKKFNSEKSKNENKLLPNCHTEQDPFLSQYVEEDIALLTKLNSFTYFRTKQLIQLRYLRNSPKTLEQRNNFSLLVYSALRSSLSHHDAWERLLSFNKGFKEPMTLPELENVICTAKHKDGYKFSNGKVIDFLQITPDEQEKIGLSRKNADKSGVASSSHAHQKNFTQLKKGHYKEKIISLFEAGVPCKKIAETMNRSLSIITRIVKPYRDAQNLTLYKEIRLQLDQGILFSKIARTHPILKTFSSSTQQRYKVKAETC